MFLEEVFGSVETDPDGEFGIFIYILQMHIEINKLCFQCVRLSAILRKCLYENMGIFWPFGWGAFGGNTPKLVEWGEFRNFGF